MNYSPEKRDPFSNQHSNDSVEKKIPHVELLKFINHSNTASASQMNHSLQFSKGAFDRRANIPLKTELVSKNRPMVKAIDLNKENSSKFGNATHQGLRKPETTAANSKMKIDVGVKSRPISAQIKQSTKVELAEEQKAPVIDKKPSSTNPKSSTTIPQKMSSNYSQKGMSSKTSKPSTFNSMRPQTANPLSTKPPWNNNLTSKTTSMSKVQNTSNVKRTNTTSSNSSTRANSKNQPLKAIQKPKKEPLEPEIIDYNPDECQICLTSLFDESTDSPPRELSILDRCGHLFHKECLIPYLTETITNWKFPIKCAHRRCMKEILSTNLKEIVSKELFAKFEEFSLKFYLSQINDRVARCFTANCPYVVEMAHAGQITVIKCPLCQGSYCLQCEKLAHDGLTCEEKKALQQEDPLVIEFVKGKQLRRCTACKFWIEKTEGCNHMTCRCNNEFCYICGTEWKLCNCEQ